MATEIIDHEKSFLFGELRKKRFMQKKKKLMPARIIVIIICHYCKLRLLEESNKSKKDLERPRAENEKKHW